MGSCQWRGGQECHAPHSRMALMGSLGAVARDVPMGDVAPPIFSNMHESWLEVSHDARELATVFSVTFSLFF